MIRCVMPGRGCRSYRWTHRCRWLPCRETHRLQSGPASSSQSQQPRFHPHLHTVRSRRSRGQRVSTRTNCRTSSMHVVGAGSPRTVAPYHTEARSPSVTSPTTLDVGATNASRPCLRDLSPTDTTRVDGTTDHQRATQHPNARRQGTHGRRVRFDTAAHYTTANIIHSAANSMPASLHNPGCCKHGGCAMATQQTAPRRRQHHVRRSTTPFRPCRDTPTRSRVCPKPRMARPTTCENMASCREPAAPAKATATLLGSEGDAQWPNIYYSRKSATLKCYLKSNCPW